MTSMTEVTILFETPFWIALIENSENGSYSVARVIIGTSEPTGIELLNLFDRVDYNSLKFTRGIKAETDFEKKMNFKRQMREARKKQSENSVLHTYTKAHALLKLQKMDIKNEQKKALRDEQEQKQIQKFELRQLKKKEKHKGH